MSGRKGKIGRYLRVVIPSTTTSHVLIPFHLPYLPPLSHHSTSRPVALPSFPRGEDKLHRTAGAPLVPAPPCRRSPRAKEGRVSPVGWSAGGLLCGRGGHRPPLHRGLGSGEPCAPSVRSPPCTRSTPYDAKPCRRSPGKEGRVSPVGRLADGLPCGRGGRRPPPL
jgi:hypothetical protein